MANIYFPKEDFKGVSSQVTPVKFYIFFFQGLPLTLNTNWKLQGVINGVPVWRNQSITDDSDGGVIACQALIQASAEVCIESNDKM